VVCACFVSVTDGKHKTGASFLFGSRMLFYLCPTTMWGQGFFFLFGNTLSKENKRRLKNSNKKEGVEHAHFFLVLVFFFSFLVGEIRNAHTPREKHRDETGAHTGRIKKQKKCCRKTVKEVTSVGKKINGFLVDTHKKINEQSVGKTFGSVFSK